MKSRAGGHGGLLAADVALVNFSCPIETSLLAFTFGAAEPLGPAHLNQVLPAGLLRRETPLKIDQTQVMVRLFRRLHAALVP